MTDDRMALIELIEKGADADLVRELLAFAAERMMELEVEARTGAPAGVRSADRLTHRNGYRERPWDEQQRCSSGRTDRAGDPEAEEGVLPSVVPGSTAALSTDGPPRRPSRPSSRRPTCTGSRRGPSTTS